MEGRPRESNTTGTGKRLQSHRIRKRRDSGPRERPAPGPPSGLAPRPPPGSENGAGTAHTGLHSKAAQKPPPAGAGVRPKQQGCGHSALQILFPSEAPAGRAEGPALAASENPEGRPGNRWIRPEGLLRAEGQSEARRRAGRGTRAGMKPRGDAVPGGWQDPFLSTPPTLPLTARLPRAPPRNFSTLRDSGGKRNSSPSGSPLLDPTEGF